MCCGWICMCAKQPVIERGGMLLEWSKAAKPALRCLLNRFYWTQAYLSFFFFLFFCWADFAFCACRSSLTMWIKWSVVRILSAPFRTLTTTSPFTWWIYWRNWVTTQRWTVNIRCWILLLGLIIMDITLLSSKRKRRPKVTCGYVVLYRSRLLQRRSPSGLVIGFLLRKV